MNDEHDSEESLSAWWNASHPIQDEMISLIGQTMNNNVSASASVNTPTIIIGDDITESIEVLGDRYEAHELKTMLKCLKEMAKEQYPEEFL